MTSWQFWIDRGGTFTDIVARAPDGRLITHKILSEQPGRAQDAAAAGIAHLRGNDPQPIELVRMGTTVATNALLERKGTPTLLLINCGFGDLLEIGTQARPRLFDLAIEQPKPLAAQVAEISGRVAADGTLLEPLDPAEIHAALAEARAAGIGAVAIALIHAWAYPDLEQQVAALVREAGFTEVSASHQVAPVMRLLPRAQTAVADAYLSPVLRRYVDQVAAALGEVPLFFMQSHGGLAGAAQFRGKDAVLSGPAGGIVGAMRSAAGEGITHLVGFDMGGTSTDVALAAGELSRASGRLVAGVRLEVPMLDIETVAAGGGSIIGFDGLRLTVGPASAGAVPGPACYRNGGPLTVTDANLLLGKIVPAHFPALFGPSGDQPLDCAVVARKFADLAAQIGQTPQAVAEGALAIAVARMAQSVRKVALARGHDPARFSLVAFGGAGGQHACLVADRIGMETILVPRLAGVLSAYGIGLADQSVLRQSACNMAIQDQALAGLVEDLGCQALAALAGATALKLQVGVLARGAELPLMVGFAAAAMMIADFKTHFRARYGYDYDEDEAGLRAALITAEAILPGETPAAPMIPPRAQPLHPDTTEIWLDHRAQPVPLYARDDLRPGDVLPGPALIVEANATTMIEPGWSGRVTDHDQLILTRVTPRVRVPDDAAADPAQLTWFNNAFVAVAEEAGAVLAAAARSVNIRERLDFSCALFDAAGNLIANAPHVPVHLGAMGESVKHVLASRPDLRPGDVVALNDPFAGGTHLPDITVITPLFDEAGSLRFLLGSRGHHTDVGGTRPGSTPPFSRKLAEEGVVITDFLLVAQGRLRDAAFIDLLSHAPYPARDPQMNLADIKAQIAANQAGIGALLQLIGDQGWDRVARYGDFVMDNAAACVRRLIGRLQDGAAELPLDNGGLIRVAVRVDRAAQRLAIDFSGTSPARGDNFNAPRQIARSVVLYVLRCLVAEDIPLNEGCLAPVDLIVPAGSMIDPVAGAAVVAGNTEVSQAMASCLLLALNAQAAGQTTMNNLLFGNDLIQYYETICGGAGAGPGFQGASAIHTNMTNTRATDPEVLEWRLPVRVERFARRHGSGGAGRFAGGDGAIRALRFLKPVQLSLIAGSRIYPPPGLGGGAPGMAGTQYVMRADGSREELPGTAAIDLEPGDLFVIETPGGGGYGA